jgi:hypothetical protein
MVWLPFALVFTLVIDVVYPLVRLTLFAQLWACAVRNRVATVKRTTASLGLVSSLAMVGDTDGLR